MLSSYEYSYSYEYVQLNATFQLREFIIRRRAHTFGVSAVLLAWRV